MRAVLMASLLTAVLMTGCAAGAGPTGQVVRAGASPAAVETPTEVPSPTPSQSSPPDAVAVPTCLQPEVRPDVWTPSCGDAGYQLWMQWDSWTNTAAAAHGEAHITHGLEAGGRWPMRVVFDRPVRVPGMANRVLFSRAVVTYLKAPGPDGVAGETFALADVWEQAELIASMPVDPCTTDADGVSNCAPNPPDPAITTTTGGQ